MKEWYLIGNNTMPNMTGGYESDAFNDFKDDAFSEVLDSPIGKIVKIYNSSMTECKTLRCVIQDNTSNTQLKSMERSILTTIGTIKAGMYVLFEDRYWLITGYPGNNGIYEKATMILCQYKLKWQKSNGDIIERWANFVSASKYDVGQFGNNYITLASNNFTVLIPEDDDGITLENKRVFIDRNINSPRKVFEITRSDDVLYLYGKNHGGVLSFIADRDEFNSETDKPDLGICDYCSPTDIPVQPENPDSTQSILATISGNANLKIGFNRTYSVSFSNTLGNTINPYFTWNIVSDFPVKSELVDKKIKLLVENEDYISSSFLLQVIVENAVVGEIEITVIEGF